MAEASSDRAIMREQIASQPALLRDIVEPAARRVEEALRLVQPERWSVIYTAGCGDSFYAGLACEMAFGQFCRMPVKALAAMPFARYESAVAGRRTPPAEPARRAWQSRGVGPWRCAGARRRVGPWRCARPRRSLARSWRPRPGTLRPSEKLQGPARYGSRARARRPAHAEPGHRRGPAGLVAALVVPAPARIFRVACPASSTGRASDS